MGAPCYGKCVALLGSRPCPLSHLSEHPSPLAPLPVQQVHPPAPPGGVWRQCDRGGGGPSGCPDRPAAPVAGPGGWLRCSAVQCQMHILCSWPPVPGFLPRSHVTPWPFPCKGTANALLFIKGQSENGRGPARPAAAPSAAPVLLVFFPCRPILSETAWHEMFQAGTPGSSARYLTASHRLNCRWGTRASITCPN